MRSMISSFVMLASLLVVVVSFQNCASETPFGATTELDSLIEGTVFPYKADFDQIAYMSCSEQGDVFPDPQTFFTFRAGAYRQGGLRVSPDFLSQARNMSGAQKKSVMDQSLISAGTQLQFALRPSNNFQSMFASETSGGQGVSGSDFATAFAPLGEDSITNQLLSLRDGESMRLWTGATFESETRLEGSIRFADSELLQNDMRSEISRGLMLALTFADNDGLPRGPGFITGDAANLRRNVYGSAVQMRFKQAFPGDYPGAGFAGATPSTDTPPRLLASVEDVPVSSLTEASELRSWTCPANLALRIVLPQHAVAQNCQTLPDPLIPSAELNVVRQSLYAEDWYIDLVNRCAVPKPERVQVGTCYGIDSGTQETRVIQYDFSQPCGLGDGKGACAHFVSVCIRD